MKTLLDTFRTSVLQLFADHPGGVPLRLASEHVGASMADAKNTAIALADKGELILIRRGKGGAYFILPPGSRVWACVICRKEFTPPRYRSGKTSKRVTCSRPCQAAMGWNTPEKRERKMRGLRQPHVLQGHKERLVEINKRRWAKPEEHEKLREQNRREWKDQEKAAVRAAKIRLNHKTPEMRKLYSDMRKEWWADPAMRKKMTDAVNASEGVQNYRKNFGKHLKKRWEDPEFREKYAAANARRANDPELKAKNSARMKALWADPEWRSNITAKIRVARAKVSA